MLENKLEKSWKKVENIFSGKCRGWSGDLSWGTNGPQKINCDWVATFFSSKKIRIKFRNYNRFALIL